MIRNCSRFGSGGTVGTWMTRTASARSRSCSSMPWASSNFREKVATLSRSISIGVLSYGAAVVALDIMDARAKLRRLLCSVVLRRG